MCRPFQIARFATIVGGADRLKDSLRDINEALRDINGADGLFEMAGDPQDRPST